ncbi:MAG: glutaredoxin family protein [Rubrivivax sp.]|nr:glutaredoxin family protein [Rubrivivax sp.]
MKPRFTTAGVVSFARHLCLLWLLGLGVLFDVDAAPGPHAAASAAAATPVVVQVYVREGCPHCADAKRFLDRLALERPGLRVETRPVDEDPQARDELSALSRAAGVWPPGVPTFVVQGRALVGYDDEMHTGRAIVELLESGSALQKQEVQSRLFGTLSASRLGLPLFTLALGLLDGFNPCAMWVLLFLLSLLVRLKDRQRMALIAGTFVFVSGAVYYAFMAAWLNVFLAVGLSQAVRLLLAAVALVIGAFNVKDFLAWGLGPSLSIPANAKPGLYARMRRVVQARALPASLLAVAALAVVVNFIELLCTAGLPAIYTAVLAQQSLGAAAHYAYLGLYIVGYIADDALMVGLAVAALGSGKLTERTGRWLKFVSGLVMLGLGGVLLLRPQWLY